MQSSIQRRHARRETQQLRQLENLRHQTHCRRSRSHRSRRRSHRSHRSRRRSRRSRDKRVKENTLKRILLNNEHMHDDPNLENQVHLESDHVESPPALGETIPIPPPPAINQGTGAGGANTRHKNQRTVSKNLGKNNTADHEKIYDHIEKNSGATKKCTFGHKCGSKTGVKHEGPEDVPIRDYHLKGCSIKNGKVSIKSGDGLQGFCKHCERLRRSKRLEMSRENNKDGGYDKYEKDYGKNTKKCSSCEQEKNVRDCFKLSPGMECGIHNSCNDCSRAYGDSMGDRLIKYRPDGNFKYKKTEKNQHDDHIMPLAYGGTNEEVNHQLLSSKENLNKSSTIPYKNVNEIPLENMCERWRPLLEKAKSENISMTDFKSRIFTAIAEEQKYIYSKTDAEIELIYKEYNKKNNRRVDPKRCVEKFKKYCKEILKFED